MKYCKCVNLTTFIRAFVIIVLSAGALYGQQGHTECWHHFRVDSKLTGFSSMIIPQNLDLLWKMETGERFKSSPVICQQNLFIASEDGAIISVGQGGNLRWKVQAGVGIEAPPMIINNTVVVGALDGTVYCIQNEEGNILWKYASGGQISGSVNTFKVGNTTGILLGNYDYQVICIGKDTGKALWKFEADNFINGTIANDNNIGVFGGCDAFLRVLDLTLGTQKSKVDLGIYLAANPALDQGMAYLGDYEGSFYAVDLQKQQVLWKYSDERNNLPFLSSPALDQDRIYVGSDDKQVYCFDKSDGKVLWKFRTSHRVNASPVVTQKEVFIGSNDGRIYRIDKLTGKEIWSFDTGDRIQSTVAISQQKLYVATAGGTIYCFGKK